MIPEAWQDAGDYCAECGRPPEKCNCEEDIEIND